MIEPIDEKYQISLRNHLLLSVFGGFFERLPGWKPLYNQRDTGVNGPEASPKRKNSSTAARGRGRRGWGA